MGRATNNLHNRLKALALDRKKYKITGTDILSNREKIADCRAKIRQCERDMDVIGSSQQIENKIVQYKNEIKILEQDLE